MLMRARALPDIHSTAAELAEGMALPRTLAGHSSAPCSHSVSEGGCARSGIHRTAELMWCMTVSVRVHLLLRAAGRLPLPKLGVWLG